MFSHPHVCYPTLGESSRFILLQAVKGLKGRAGALDLPIITPRRSKMRWRRKINAPLCAPGRRCASAAADARASSRAAAVPLTQFGRPRLRRERHAHVTHLCLLANSVRNYSRCTIRALSTLESRKRKRGQRVTRETVDRSCRTPNNPRDSNNFSAQPYDARFLTAREKCVGVLPSSSCGSRRSTEPRPPTTTMELARCFSNFPTSFGLTWRLGWPAERHRRLAC